MAETCHFHGKVDHHVSATRKRDGYKQLHDSVGFTKCGNMPFRPVTVALSNMLQGKSIDLREKYTKRG